jgi:hypothetical protein
MKSEAEIRSAIRQTKEGLVQALLVGRMKPEEYGAHCLYHRFLEHFEAWIVEDGNVEEENYAGE